MATLTWFILWLVILISLSAFFSCSETSLFSLSRNDLSYLKDRRPASGTLAETLLATPKKTLVTILIGNMFVNVLSTALFEQKLHDIFHTYAILISIAVMTPLILLFGEIIPKIIAFRFKRVTVPLFSPVIRVMYFVLYPFQVLSIKLSEPFLGLFTLIFPSDSTEETAYDKSEINAAIEIGAARGIFNEYEKDLIQNIMKIDTVSSRYLVTPRTKIFSIDIDDTLEEIQEQVYASEFSRIPFFQNTQDNIVGVFFKKDLFRSDSIFKSRSTFKQFLQKPWFVPETLNAGKLFALMVGRKSHIHFAVDEYGGLEGLITLDDILSKIFKTGADETEIHDLIQPLKKGKGYSVRSNITVEDFNEHLSPPIEDTDAVTLGGFAAHQLGRIPETGDSFEYEGFRFTVSGQIDEDVYTVAIRHTGKGGEES